MRKGQRPPTEAKRELARVKRDLAVAGMESDIFKKQPHTFLLGRCGMAASMSRKGNCYDHAPMEIFWDLLKDEQTHHYRHATRQEAMADIMWHTEIFYNRQRKQARWGYLSSAAFERWFYEKQFALKSDVGRVVLEQGDFPNKKRTRKQHHCKRHKTPFKRKSTPGHKAPP